MDLQREGREIAEASLPLAVLEPRTCGTNVTSPLALADDRAHASGMSMIRR